MKEIMKREDRKKQIHNEMLVRVIDQVYFQIWDQIRGRVKDQIMNQVSIKVWEQIRHHLINLHTKFKITH
jgi:hypothetical protein